MTKTNTSTIPNKKPRKILRNTLFGIVSIPAVFFAGKGVYHASDAVFGITEQTKIEQNLSENALETPGKITMIAYRNGAEEYHGSDIFMTNKNNRAYRFEVVFDGDKQRNKKFTSASTLNSTTIAYDNEGRIDYNISDDALITITKEGAAPSILPYGRLDPTIQAIVKKEYELMLNSGISNDIKKCTEEIRERKHIEEIIRKTQEKFSAKMYQDSANAQAKKHLREMYK